MKPAGHTDGAATPTGFEPRALTVEANGLRMNVVGSGAVGPAVVLLHGFPQSSRAYVRVASDLARDARVFAPDLRGAGGTDAPAHGYDVDTLCADILGLIDSLGLDRVTLVAHDWSALVGFELCLRAPERIDRFVAIAVPAPYIRMTPRLALGMARALPHLWFQWVIATPGIGPRLLSRGRQRLSRWLLRAFEVRPMNEADVAAYVETLRDPARARAASRLYRRLILPGFMNIMRGTYRGRVLAVPTLVLFGAEDRLLPREALEFAREDAVDLRVEFVPGSSHFIVDEAPDAVARHIRAFAGLATR